MPELPEVETIVRQLRPQIVGRRVVAVSVHWERTLGGASVDQFENALVGRCVERVWRRAKYFVLDLDDGTHIVGHLRMSGRLYVSPDADLPYARVSLALDDGRHLVFSDVRKFGRFAHVARLDDGLPALGPEPLEDSFDAAWLHGALRSRKRALKPLLLDQSFIAGLGNIYVDESLFTARLHPLRLSHTLKRAQSDELATAIRDVLARAVALDGSSFDTFYRTIEGQPGAYQDEFLVYGRDGKPCRRCGHVIAKMLVAQRGTHLCRRCQRAPRTRRRT